DDVALAVQREIADITFGCFAGMADQGVRDRGKIEVFGKKLGGRHEVGDLQEPAGLANGEAEGEFRFRFGKVFRTKEVVRKGLNAKIQDEFAVGRIAGAAAE